MRYELPRTTLGRTGLSVTRLGIGGAYCETVEGYRAALDCGVNYVDTARTYRDGEDERVIGEAIRGRRHELVLATKSDKRDAASARAELETSLRLLRTDYVDVWQIHYLNTKEERERVLAPGGALEAAVKAREQGLVRFIGVTGHNWEQVGLTVATGLFDTVLCWYNAAMKEPEELVFPHAIRHNTAAVIMSASRQTKLLGGEGAPPDEDFYRYVVGHPAVAVTLMALRDVDHFRRVAAAMAEEIALTPEQRAELEAYGARLRAEGALELE